VVTLPPALQVIVEGALRYSGLEKVIFEKSNELETIGKRGSAYLLLFPIVPCLPQFESYACLLSIIFFRRHLITTKS